MKKRIISDKRYGNNILNVFIRFAADEILVGKLILDNRLVYFKYDEEFLKLDLNLSPFKLKYNNEIQVAEPKPFNGLFGLFADSLPDGWGMLLLNRALSKRDLSLHDIHVLDQLAYVGENGKGALIYRPVIEGEKQFKEGLDIDTLKTAMDTVYSGASTQILDELFRLGGSSGGARPKANVGYNPKTDELIHGENELPPGFEHWILKFPSSDDPIDIANIEYAYHKMAVAANIDMSPCTLLKSKKGFQVFATKRFDREGNDRIHMQSMAGLKHDNFRLSSIDYGHLIDTAYQLERSAIAREKMLRRAAFNIFTHNRDDHSKNFSWLMNSSGEWRLSPAYDLTYSSTGMNEHSTRVAGEGANPGKKHLLELAEEFSIVKVHDIIADVQDAIRQWSKIAKKCGVRADSMRRIGGRLNGK